MPDCQKWTFCGSLDDRVQKFGYDPLGRTRPLPPLDVIVENTLFGNPMIVPEGFLIANGGLLQDLLSGEASVLAALVDHDYVRVLSREAGLVPWLERTRAFHVQDQQDNHIRLAPHQAVLAAFDDRCARAGGFMPFPLTDCSDIHESLLRERLTSDEVVSLLPIATASPHFPLFVATFRNAMDEEIERLNGRQPATRSVFERAVDRIFDDVVAHGEIRCELMGFANEGYHVAYQAALCHELDRRVKVTTYYSDRFVPVPSKPLRDIAVADAIGPSSRTAGMMRLDRTLVRHRLGDLIRRHGLLDPATPLGEARKRMIQALADATRYRQRDIDERCTEYERRLSEALGAPSSPTDRRLDLRDSFVVQYAVAAAGGAMAAAAGEVLAWQAAGQMEETKRRGDVLDRISRRNFLKAARNFAIGTYATLQVESSLFGMVDQVLDVYSIEPGQIDPKLVGENFPIIPVAKEKDLAMDPAVVDLLVQSARRHPPVAGYRLADYTLPEGHLI